MRANSYFQQEAHPERAILKAKTPASLEVTGGACVILKPAWAKFQEARPQEGGLAGACSSPDLFVHQHFSPRRQETRGSPSLGFPTLSGSGDLQHLQLEPDLTILLCQPAASRKPLCEEALSLPHSNLQLPSPSAMALGTK